MSDSNLTEQILTEWDISFWIKAEILLILLTYAKNLRMEIPIKFYTDKIFINFKSGDNVRYTEITIDTTAVTNYNPGLDEIANINSDNSVIDNDNSAKSAGATVDSGSIIKDDNGQYYKVIFTDLDFYLNKLKELANKDDSIFVRIDSKVSRKIEFHMGNIIRWARISPSGVTINLKDAESFPGKVYTARNDPSKARCIIEPATFAKMLATADVDEKIYITLSKDVGLLVTGGNKSIGGSFQVTQNANTQVNDTAKSAENFQEDLDKEYEQLVRFKNPKYKPKEKKPAEGVKDLLLAIDADVKQSVCVKVEYLYPFQLLKGMSPISMEIRNDRPLLLEQRPYDGITVLLAVAPYDVTPQERQLKNQK